MALTKILFVVCELALPKMGYCQGLNYLAVIFFKILDGDEEQTYKFLLGFILRK